MESKDQRCLQILEPIELLLFFSDSRIKMLQYTFFCLLMKILQIFLWLTIKILKKKIPSRPAWQFNSKLLFDIWLVIIKISPPTLDSQYSKLLSDIWMVKIKICAGVTTASHGPSPSTGDNNDNDYAWYLSILVHYHIGVFDTLSDSIQSFAKKWFIQYLIQSCFTQGSIQNIIQSKKYFSVSIQKIIQFNSLGIIDTGRMGQVP